MSFQARFKFHKTEGWNHSVDLGVIVTNVFIQFYLRLRTDNMSYEIVVMN
jgi:hypothetical protein